MTIFLIIFAIIYVLSAFGAYNFMQHVYHHPNGKWNMLTPDPNDYFWVFMPFFNIFPAFDFLIGNWQDRDVKAKEEFFKPRKPFKP